MPGAKNGERPYLAVSVPSFSDPFFAYFYAILYASQPNFIPRDIFLFI